MNTGANLRKINNFGIANTIFMFKVYFENRAIIICGEDDNFPEDANAVILRLNGNKDFRETVRLFENGNGLERLYIPAKEPEKLFNRFRKEFSEIDAGGGLVENRRGDYLMIYRNGLWDLPKGKREKGEKRKATALREVREETGLKEISPGGLICVTHHCYRWKGQGELIMKHTYWYRMTYTAPIELIPQTEEDITKATWIAKSTLPSYLTNTYPSITEVFREAGII